MHNKKKHTQKKVRKQIVNIPFFVPQNAVSFSPVITFFERAINKNMAHFYKNTRRFLWHVSNISYPTVLCKNNLPYHTKFL